jgi:hypothetical protein
MPNSGRLLITDGKVRELDINNGVYAQPVYIAGGDIAVGDVTVDNTDIINRLTDIRDEVTGRIPSGLQVVDGKLIVEVNDGSGFIISNDNSNPVPISLVDLGDAATAALQTTGNGFLNDISSKLTDVSTETKQDSIINELLEIKDLIPIEPIIVKQFGYNFRDEFSNSQFTGANWDRIGRITTTSNGGGSYNFSSSSDPPGNEFKLTTKFQFEQPIDIYFAYQINDRNNNYSIYFELIHSDTERSILGWLLNGEDKTIGNVFINDLDNSNLVKHDETVDINNAVFTSGGGFSLLGIKINYGSISFYQGNNIEDNTTVFTAYDEILNEPGSYKFRVRIVSNVNTVQNLRLNLDYVAIHDSITPNYTHTDYTKVLERIETLLTPIYYQPVVKVIENSIYSIPPGAKSISVVNVGDESATIQNVEIFPGLSLGWGDLGLDVFESLEIDATDTKLIITYTEAANPRTARFILQNGGYIIQE